MSSLNKRFYEVLENVIRSINNRKLDINGSLPALIKEHEDKISALGLLTDSVLKKDVERLIVDSTKSISSLKDSIEQNKKWLEKDLIELNILQDICPHTNNKFDYTDYHKNEDFHKCLTCGKSY